MIGFKPVSRQYGDLTSSNIDTLYARTFRAWTIAPAARSWLAHAHKARVLHVFDHACNLINEQGEVLSIVGPGIGNGPFNIVIGDVYSSFRNYVEADAQATCSPDQITLGQMTVNLRPARAWSPRPDWAKLRLSRDRIFMQLLELQEWIQEHAKPDSLLHCEPFGSQRDLLFIVDRSRLTSLCTAVASADIQCCRNAAQSLVGLGPGLTPAGDDFILGAMLAAWIIHPPELAKVVTVAMADSAAPLTTSLSAAWLRAASDGEAGILWHSFFQALISADTVTIRQSIQQLLAVGHTSGADALAGFVGAFSAIRHRLDIL